MRTSLLLACVLVFGVFGCGDQGTPRAGPPPKGVDFSKSTLFNEGSITPYRFEFRRSPGELVPGAKLTIDVAIGRDAGAPKPEKVWIWVGSQDGVGAKKVAAVAMDGDHGEHWRAQVEIPNPWPTDCLANVETESAVGGRRVSLPFQR